MATRQNQKDLRPTLTQDEYSLEWALAEVPVIVRVSRKQPLYSEHACGYHSDAPNTDVRVTVSSHNLTDPQRGKTRAYRERLLASIGVP